MAIERQSKMYRVTDTSATANNPKRTHEIIINGEIKSVFFEYGKATLVPFEEAAKFQKSEGFIVTNDEGNVMEKPSDVPPAIMHTMKTNECIARFDEMTREALYMRSVMLPGGEKFKGNAGKDDLVAFLTAANIAAVTPNNESQSDQTVGGLAEDMTEEEISVMAEVSSQEAA